MPELEKTFRDDSLNDSRSNAIILVNGREISVLNGLETNLSNGDEIVFVPVVHGG
jgi:molybdopterin converting factor small subunit